MLNLNLKKMFAGMPPPLLAGVQEQDVWGMRVGISRCFFLMGILKIARVRLVND